MKSLLIKNGRVIDPVNKVDGVVDILIEDGKISQIGKNIFVKDCQLIDANNLIVMPAIVDMHVHLREPGREDKETIESATSAALKGGVTSLLAMPNTIPVIDSLENIRLLKSIITKSARANVFIAGAITKGRLGKELSDIEGLKEEGAAAITDDGFSVDDGALFLEALKKAKKYNLLVMPHCEDKKLSAGGVVNLGFTSTRMGLRGISKESEYKRVERDIELAKKVDTKLHITHVSCKESVELIAGAKKSGLRVTCDTTPHYFSLTEEAVLGYDTNKKMNPPLRSSLDVEVIKQALKDGTIDVIVSDHAPHTENEKDIEFENAEFGVIGLETELAVAFTELVNTGFLNPAQLIEKMTINPAQILGIKKGSLTKGIEADIAIVSADKEWVVTKENFLSKSKNSAFLGAKLKGEVIYTIHNGEVVYSNTKQDKNMSS